jgi:tight adherence protein C
MFETPNIEELLATVGTYLTIQLGEVSLGPVETSVFVLALAAALRSGFNLWRISRSETRQDRLVILRHAFLCVTPVNRRPRSPRWKQGSGTDRREPSHRLAEQQRLLGALAAAGIKGHGDLATFIASKLCAAVAFAAVTWLFLEWKQFFGGLAVVRVALLLGALMLGWRFPDIVLLRLAARRRRHIEQGLPDALDLLVICAEAGLSLDQAIDQVAHDMRAANPAVADEFATTAVEMRVLTDRSQALENLVQRTGLPTLRGITATLTQAIRFGTPLAESMRILAAELRTERLARLEERAARLPVLLAIPMMMFILPCLLMVIGTPVALRVGDTLRQVIHKGF